MIKNRRHQKWKDLSCSWIDRTNIIKMSRLLKTVYRFIVIPIKIPIKFFTDPDKMMLKFMWKPWIAKAIVNSTNKAGGITIPDLNMYSLCAVIQATRYWHENRHTDQGNKIEIPEINSHVYIQLIVEKRIEINPRRQSLPQTVLGTSDLSV